MADIKQLFATVTRAPTTQGVQGYWVRNKYFDARRSREERQLSTSRERKNPVNVSPKMTFLDEVCRKEKKKPGPSTYDPFGNKIKPAKTLDVKSAPRTTFIDDLTKHQKKLNIPAAGKYDKIELQPKKDRNSSRSPLNKAEVCSYLDNQMRKSIQIPGTGNYNVNIHSGNQGPKWMPPKGNPKKRSESQRGIKAPDMGSYHPLSYGLFDSMSSGEQKQRAYFGRQQRFKSGKVKPTPFYNVGSEWGMKDKLHRKDILSKVGSSVTNHSIYY